MDRPRFPMLVIASAFVTFDPASASGDSTTPAVTPAVLDDPCVARSGDACRQHALDDFRAALAAVTEQGAKSERIVRIAAFGDSVIATDHIADQLRVNFANLSGGDGGPGFVWAIDPHPYNQHAAVTVVHNGSWQVWGVSTQPAADRLLGLGGSVEGSGTIRWLPRAPISSIDVHYLAQPGGGSFEIAAGKTVLATVATASDAKAAGFRKVEVPPAAAGAKQSVEVRARGRVRLFGAALESRKGVVVDNLGIVNANAKGMASYNLADHLRGQLAHRRADLVVVMYGTNEAEWLVPASSGMSEHERVIGELLATIRAANPTGGCLVISPLDQLDWREANAPPRRSIPAMVDVQRKAAQAHGCAFWDAYQWMGGKGASLQWFKRGLLIKDFQHPTTAGAKRIADALFAGLTTRARP